MKSRKECFAHVSSIAVETKTILTGDAIFKGRWNEHPRTGSVSETQSTEMEIRGNTLPIKTRSSTLSESKSSLEFKLMKTLFPFILMISSIEEKQLLLDS